MLFNSQANGDFDEEDLPPGQGGQGGKGGQGGQGGQNNDDDDDNLFN